jgi:hypothetical protein
MALVAEQPAFEMSCRIKAKEIAADTYRGCVTENRKAQIDQIRSDYQTKLKSLKDEYDQELKKVSGASNSSESSELKDQPNTTRRSPRSSPSRVAAKGLPGKRKATRPTAPSSNDDMTVQLRSHTRSNQPIDDSSMDIPEPIPVENLDQSSDSQI